MEITARHRLGLTPNARGDDLRGRPACGLE